VFVPLAVLLVATTNPPDWGHTFWSSTWYDIEIPVELTANKQIFVMLRDEPLSYIIPFLPPDTRFVRIAGNLWLSPQTKLFKHVWQTIKSHEGPIYSLSLFEPTEKEIALLKKYGLMITQRNCIHFNSKLNPVIAACPLQRIPSEPK